MRPQSRFCAPYHRLAYEYKPLTTEILDGVTHQVVAVVKKSSIHWRQGRWALNGWNEKNILKFKQDISIMFLHKARCKKMNPLEEIVILMSEKVEPNFKSW